MTSSWFSSLYLQVFIFITESMNGDSVDWMMLSHQSPRPDLQAFTFSAEWVFSGQGDGIISLLSVTSSWFSNLHF